MISALAVQSLAKVFMNTFQLSGLPLPAELHLNGVCFKEEEETEEKAAMILPLRQLLMFLWKTNW